MNLDVITIQDCEELYKFKGISVVIEDGKVTNFTRKDRKHA